MPAPPADTRDVALPAVGGDEDLPPVVATGGLARLHGSLGFDGSGVEGATVRLERWVGDRSAWIETTTGPGGGWSADALLGGRWVIRAWKGDRLVLPTASAVFLTEDEDREIHLAMEQIRPSGGTDEAEGDDAAAQVEGGDAGDADGNGDTDDRDTDDVAGTDPGSGAPVTEDASTEDASADDEAGRP